MSKKGGRPGKYYTHVEPRLIEIEGWARDGLIDEQISKNLGVAYSTFKIYKKKYSDLMAALKKGKEVVDREVENALLKRALGYEYTETTEEPIIDPKTGKIEMGISKKVTKHINPDTTAQIFWLKNRKPEQWRDKKDFEHSGEMTQTVKQEHDLSKLSVEELKELEEIIGKSITDTESD